MTVSVICVAVWVPTDADYFWSLCSIGFIGLTVVLHALELLKGGSDRSTSAPGVTSRLLSGRSA